LVDVNVWLALAYRLHVHHGAAREWFDTLSKQEAFFCRVTQLGLLRIVTNRKVMDQDVLSQREAWRLFDRIAADERIAFTSEPAGADVEFRRLTQASTPSTRMWTDAYLAAIASAGNMTVATMDKGFSAFADVNVSIVPT
jgi:hypothetical protein